MPLEILLALVIGGIAFVALLLHLLGHSRAAPFTQDSARAAWQRHAPEDPPLAIHLSEDARAVLIETAKGPALVFQMGVDSTGHWLENVRLSDTKPGLRIDLHDFAAPFCHVRLRPEARTRWRQIIDTASAQEAAAQEGAING